MYAVCSGNTYCLLKYLLGIDLCSMLEGLNGVPLKSEFSKM